MSAKELLGLCMTCGQLHPVNGPCPGARGVAPGTVVLHAAPHACGDPGQAGHLYRELCAVQRQCVDLQRGRVELERTVAGLHAMLAATRRERDEARAERDRLRARLAESERRAEVVPRLSDAAATAERERDEALAVLRRWQEWFRAGTDQPIRQAENSGDIARAAAALLARHPAPAHGPSRVADGLPVVCQSCGARTETLTDGRCGDCSGERVGRDE